MKYLYRNERFLGDYASRYRAGLPISSASAESVVNCVISKRLVKKQQMRWSPTGAWSGRNHGGARCKAPLW